MDIESFGIDDSPIVKRFIISPRVHDFVYSILDVIPKYVTWTKCHWDDLQHCYVKCTHGNCCNHLGEPIIKYGVVLLEYHSEKGFTLFPWIMGENQFKVLTPVLGSDFTMRQTENGHPFVTVRKSFIKGRKLWRDNDEMRFAVEDHYPDVHSELVNWMTFPLWESPTSPLVYTNGPNGPIKKAKSLPKPPTKEPEKPLPKPPTKEPEKPKRNRIIEW